MPGTELTIRYSLAAALVTTLAFALAAPAPAQSLPRVDGPLTLKFLLQDIAPILLIALPMTMIITRLVSPPSTLLTAEVRRPNELIACSITCCG